MHALFQPIKTLALFLGLTFLLYACKRNSKFQDEGEVFLQGTWTQDSVPFQDSLLKYKLHHFRFTCDSVYVTLQHRSKARTIPEECYNNGEWKEYAKGVYIIRNDSLLIEATYTHADWRQKITGCHTIGQYHGRFKLKRNTADSLSLMGRNSHLPVSLKKIKTTKCTPQQVY